MYNFVENEILDFLKRPGKSSSTINEIVNEFPHRNPEVIKTALKGLVESGDVWSEGNPIRYTVISVSG